MAFSREKRQVWRTVNKAGGGEELTIRTPAIVDRFTGVQTGSPTEITVVCTRVRYSKNEFGNPEIPNGLMKILIPSVDKSNTPLVGLSEAINDTNSVIILADGAEIGIRYHETTQPNTTDILAVRLFLGG